MITAEYEEYYQELERLSRSKSLKDGKEYQALRKGYIELSIEEAKGIVRMWIGSKRVNSYH